MKSIDSFLEKLLDYPYHQEENMSEYLFVAKVPYSITKP